MGEALRKRIGQRKPSTAQQDAMVNLIVTADEVRRRLEAACREAGLTLSQYNVLRILRGAGPEGSPRCDVADRMLEHAPDVTRLIDKLESRGLAERRRCTEDRRLSLSTITDAGREAVDRATPHVEAVQQWFTSRVSGADARELSRICEGVYGAE